MNFLIGMAVVTVCVFGGFAALGGNLLKLWQPGEIVIILGAAVGAFIVGNPTATIKRVPAGFKDMIAGSRYSKQSYLELLSLLYQTFKLAKAKGMLALEGHVEHPADSNLFSGFPGFAKDKKALNFLCDYLRLLTLGTDNPHEIEALVDEEIDIQHKERVELPHAIQLVGDACPALGIVAAVLGVIKTMALINEPIEVLTGAIGAALVGTFLGVLLGYCIFLPIAQIIKTIYDEEQHYYLCIKAGLLAYMQGHAPAVCIEFSRKILPHHVRPTFYEVEEATQSLPPV